MVNKKVSIIIPVCNTCEACNSDEYLRKNIESVINQTYKNIEILYIDNNSTDNSIEIIKSYNDSKIKILKEAKQGVSNARNHGIKKASGEYFTFIDSDDYVALDYIETAMAEIEDNDILIKEFYCCNIEGAEFTSLRTKAIKQFGGNIKDIYPFMECSPNIFYRTKFIRENNIYQNSDLKIGEDNLFNINAIFKANKIKIKINNTANYFYQIFETSSSNVKSNKYLTFLDAYEKIFEMGLNKYGYLNDACFEYIFIKYPAFYSKSLKPEKYEKKYKKLLKKYYKHFKISDENKLKLNNILNIKNPIINSKDISVVVQGAVDEKLTPACLASIRKILPDATIVLSTWKNSNVKTLDFDVLVENDDPGAEICDVVYNIKNNINRQILSTKNGLKIVKTKYAMKLRSDMKLVNNNFVKIFGKYDNYRNENCKIFKNRIIINNLYCANPEKTTYPFHISDWVQFGLTEDLLNLWDIELQKEPDMSRYFLNKPKPENDKNKTWLFKYIPEQYITISCLLKNKIDLDCSFYSDLSDKNKDLTYLFFANNLVIMNYKNYGIGFLKFNPYKWDYTAQMTFNYWLKFYKQYCNQSLKIPFYCRFIKFYKLDKDIIKLRKHYTGIYNATITFFKEIPSLFYYFVKIILKILTFGRL